MDKMEAKERKKPGPLAVLETVRTSVMIEPHLIEWGKAQGGLSSLIRRLLKEAHSEAKSQEKQRKEKSLTRVI